MQSLMDTVITGTMRKSLTSSSFLLGLFSKNFLRTLRRRHKFSRNLHDAFLWDGRSIHQNIDILGVNYFVENFGIVRSLIFWNGRRIRIIFQELFSRNLNGYLFCRNLQRYLFSKNLCLKKIVGI